MELKTKRNLIAGVAEAYKHRHYRGRWFKYRDYDPEPRYKQLLALPEDATEEQIVAIIGERHLYLTENVCNECEQDVEVTVCLGEEPDYESCTAWICPECLEKALELAKTA